MKDENKQPKMSLQKIEGTLENYNKIVISTEVTISLDSRSVLFDFKTKFPQAEKIIIEHNPIYIDIFLGKKLVNLLNNTINSFEQKFGKIEEPDFMKSFEKEKSRATEKVEKQKPEQDKNYMG